MEMLFLTVPPSLLWPDGIRERSEAVKANTSKKRKREGGERASRGRADMLAVWAGGEGKDEEEEEEEEEKQHIERNNQEKESFLWWEPRKDK